MMTESAVTNLHLAARAKVKFIDTRSKMSSIRFDAIYGEHANALQSASLDSAW